MEVFRIIYGVRGGFKCIQLNQANDGKLSIKSYVKDLDGLPGRSKRASLGKRGEASLNRVSPWEFYGSFCLFEIFPKYHKNFHSFSQKAWMFHWKEFEIFSESLKVP